MRKDFFKLRVHLTEQSVGIHPVLLSVSKNNIISSTPQKKKMTFEMIAERHSNECLLQLSWLQHQYPPPESVAYGCD